MALCQDADGRLLAEKQLQGFHLAAQMQLSKEALMCYWGSGRGLEAGGDQHRTAWAQAVPEPYASSIKRLRSSWEEQGRWVAMKLKKALL